MLGNFGTLLLLLPLTLAFDLDHVVNDSEDFPNDDPKEIRVERAYGNVGGPIAKCGKNCTTNATATASPESRPAEASSNGNSASGPGNLAEVGSLLGNGILSAIKPPESVLKQAYKLFTSSQNRSFSNPQDEEKYFKQFQKGLDRIKELSLLKKSPGDAVFGLTKFTDTPFDEFTKKFTGAVKSLDAATKFKIDLSTLLGIVPKRFDWRDQEVVPIVRYQKECGSCYAFSTSDLTAMQWAIDHKERKSYLLAPQYVLDCVHDKAAFGCDGGRPYLVLQTNLNCTNGTCGWPEESCYAYQNAQGKSCRQADLKCAQDKEKPKIQVRQAYYLDMSGDGQQEKDRISTLLHGGPIVALVTVTDHWQYYTGGIMRSSQCKDAGNQNHAVVIVGYNFTDPSTAHYIVRNSWDSDWGERGYFKMEAGSNTCGIAQFLSFACTENCGDGGDAMHLVDRASKRLKEEEGANVGHADVNATTASSVVGTSTKATGLGGLVKNAIENPFGG